MATRPTKPTERSTTTQAEILASPPVTFDINHPLIQQAIQQAVAVAMAAKATTMTGKSDTAQNNDWLAQKAFAKAGCKDAQPRVNIKTYNLWLAEGRKVKEGEHAVKVKNLRLFHISQTEPASAETVASNKAKIDAAAARKAKVVPINQPSA